MPATALDILKTVYGYDAFRGPQARIVDHVIAGNNAFVLMPTGGGKSLCYQIPAIIRPGLGLVVSPLLALMRKVGLDTGSADLIRAVDGRHVFLAVNPVGQFGMTSLPCNYHLEREVASYLIDHHGRARR